MDIGSTFNFHDTISDFSRLGQVVPVITNELQNPTPGIDNRYFVSQVSQSASPTLAANRVRRELTEQQRQMTEFDRQRQLQRREVAGRFSSMRNQLQRGIAIVSHSYSVGYDLTIRAGANGDVVRTRQRRRLGVANDH